MKKVVLKFGGSSLKNKDDLSKIFEVVRMYDRSFILVVSAVNGVTNSLIRALKVIKDIDIDEFLFDLYSIYQNFLDREYSDLKERVYQIRDLLMGAKLIGRVPDFVYDHVVSHGERCSSLLLSHYFNDHGLQCEEALPEQFGLLTDGRFKSASIDLYTSEKNLKDFFKDNKNYIVPGFYGIYEGEITILGRGGSDYSATSIAYCIDAERVDLYKDVSGFMTCDPKCVDGVQPVSRLTYDEAAELSYFGAKILHHSAVDPVKKKNIPLYIYNINSFRSIENPDTVISSSGSVTDEIIKSISFTDDIAIIQFKGPNVGRVPGLLGQIASNFGNEGINIKSVVTSQTSINVLISHQDIEKCRKITSKMKISEVENICYKEKISLIAAVGDGILKKHGVAARIFSAVSKQCINVQMISAGASDVTIYFLVDTRDRDNALRAIHKEFFGGERCENS
ncbi:aspartate kinase [Pseudothermotoga elfii]|uniref:aspartate kinase n=1 Tax=Pseudothermotoga elfii TaxID=38322 RepID=UPI00041DB349|nr:aspartate kinase [Pseudothermotoga elfii]MDI3495804.1 bifunctional aspartokinase / homoserine dehydrogenase 1 [Pseudothermotoga sp.]